MQMLGLPLLLLLSQFHVDYATFLGGSQDEHTVAQAVDATGSVYLTGTTNSPDFPLTSTKLGTPSQAKACGFVTKLNPGANALVWSVCLANMAPTALAVDSAGAAYVLAGSVVVKISPAGDRIVYTRSLGAVGGAALAVDSAGNAYITGTAASGFATTINAYQPYVAPGLCLYGGPTSPLVPCNDAFVMKLTPDGDTAYATYLGGSNSDEGRGIAVDAQGNAWITGDTESPNFPTTSGALQSAFHGEIDLGPLQFGDAFVAKLDPTGGKLLYSTYLGGSAADQGLAIAIDRSGSVYVAGYTQSADFPSTGGVVQPTYSGPTNAIPGGSGNGFVTKFSASGVVAYSTFGPGAGTAAAVAVDGLGNIYLPGSALTVLNPDATSILHSVPVSGGIAVDPQGFVYLTGTTRGYIFFPSQGAVQPKFGGGVYDASVMKIDFTGPQSMWVSNIVNAAGLRSGTPQNYPVFEVAPGEIVSVFGAGFDTNTRLLFDGVPAPILFVQPDQMNAVVPFEVSAPTTTMTLQSATERFGQGRMDVFDAVPALFTADQSGRGQAAVLNQDGSLNSPLNPAARGSVISVFLTGAGRMTPQQSDGSITPLAPPFPRIALGASCNIGDVVYAGAAPGLIAGAVQVNVRVSQDINSGSKVPIVVYVGNFASGFTGDATVAVR